MKKWMQMCLLILAAAMLLTACGSELPTAQISDESVNVDRLFGAESLEELESHTTQIVQGRFFDDAREDLQEEVGQIIFDATVSSFEITRVCEGDFKEGDVIKVGEEYYVGDLNGEKTLFHYGNYLPSDVGREYLMFFADPPENSKRWEDTYTPLCLERGCYPVICPNPGAVASVDQMTNGQMNLDKGDSNMYRALYKDVIKKYMQETV